MASLRAADSFSNEDALNMSNLVDLNDSLKKAFQRLNSWRSQSNQLDLFAPEESVFDELDTSASESIMRSLAGPDYSLQQDIPTTMPSSAIPSSVAAGMSNSIVAHTTPPSATLDSAIVGRSPISAHLAPLEVNPHSRNLNSPQQDCFSGRISEMTAPSYQVACCCPPDSLPQPGLATRITLEGSSNMTVSQQHLLQQQQQTHLQTHNPQQYHLQQHDPVALCTSEKTRMTDYEVTEASVRPSGVPVPCRVLLETTTGQAMSLGSGWVPMVLPMNPGLAEPRAAVTGCTSKSVVEKSAEESVGFMDQTLQQVHYMVASPGQGIAQASRLGSFGRPVHPGPTIAGSPLHPTSSSSSSSISPSSSSLSSSSPSSSASSMAAISSSSTSEWSPPLPTSPLTSGQLQHASSLLRPTQSHACHPCPSISSSPSSTITISSSTCSSYELVYQNSNSCLLVPQTLTSNHNTSVSRGIPLSTSSYSSSPPITTNLQPARPISISAVEFAEPNDHGDQLLSASYFQPILTTPDRISSSVSLPQSAGQTGIETLVTKRSIDSSEAILNMPIETTYSAGATMTSNLVNVPTLVNGLIAVSCNSRVNHQQAYHSEFSHGCSNMSTVASTPLPSLTSRLSASLPPLVVSNRSQASAFSDSSARMGNTSYACLGTVSRTANEVLAQTRQPAPDLAYCHMVRGADECLDKDIEEDDDEEYGGNGTKLPRMNGIDDYEDDEDEFNWDSIV
ncbi:unnamed protein product [Protopolystoma xenopodis]|uniref:Uncharacterized protein n=1 Tax=Protopolystoma xenopodis TaxID=117903 RepID=A0A3S5B1H1_9PLAT|nr:unnamed protein product [Protopolystoma xenopodis]